MDMASFNRYAELRCPADSFARLHWPWSTSFWIAGVFGIWVLIDGVQERTLHWDVLISIISIGYVVAN